MCGSLIESETWGICRKQSWGLLLCLDAVNARLQDKSTAVDPRVGFEVEKMGYMDAAQIVGFVILAVKLLTWDILNRMGNGHTEASEGHGVE